MNVVAVEGSDGGVWTPLCEGKMEQFEMGQDIFGPT